MNRRQFLTTATIPIGLTTAGCSFGPSEPIELDVDTEYQDDGRQNETYLIYKHSGEERRVVGFDQHSFPETLTDQFGFGVVIEYDAATTVESVRFDLRAPPTGTPADIYLASPSGSAWSDLTYGRGSADGVTRIALPDATAVTDETVFIDMRIDPQGAPVDQIAIDLELELSAVDASEKYHASTTTTFEPETQ